MPYTSTGRYLHPAESVALENDEPIRRSRIRDTHVPASASTPARRTTMRTIEDTAHESNAAFMARSIYEGVCTAANGYRFTVDGEEWTWTKFRQPEDFVMPAVGDRIRFGLDRSGYVRSVMIVEAAPSVQLAPAEVAEERESVVLSGKIEQDDRGKIITRLACVKAAAEASAGMPTEDILAQASAFEGWVLR